MSLQGKLIVFEGVDGVGKSTLAQGLAVHLNSAGIPCKYFAFPGREMGTLGYHVYMLHHNLAGFGIKAVSPTSLQILHIAAHIDAIEKTILPTLENGHHVVLDRFWWSTWVYGLVNGVQLRSLETMLDLELIHWGEISPDVAFLISRSEPLREDTPIKQWLELHNRYRELANREAKKYRVEIINNNTSVENTLGNIISITGILFQNELVSDV